MKLGLVGATGFVGQEIAKVAHAAGHQVIGYSRSEQSPTEHVSEWRESGNYDFTGIDAVISVTGYSIDRLWTDANKKKFHESRVGVTEQIVSALHCLPNDERPKVLVNASAVGYYGDSGDKVLDEASEPGSDYLAQLCVDWEEALWPVEDLGVRAVAVRIGVVLGEGGAAFEKMKTAFQLGVGGKMGDGQQWMPWVHVHDLARAFVYAFENESLHGPINGCAPEPERNVDLTKKLAKSLSRPAFFTVPAFVLKTVGGFGNMLLASLRAVPKALLSAGFTFQFQTLEAALSDLVSDDK